MSEKAVSVEWGHITGSPSDHAGLQAAFDAKADVGQQGPHVHPTSEVTGLQLELDAKENSGTAAAAVAAHEAASNPHAAYLTPAEGDALYEALGAVATHAAAGDPHPAYLKPAEADLLYEAVGAVAAHAGAGDPHPGYLTAAEGDAAYATIGHTHAGGGAPDAHAASHQNNGSDEINVAGLSGVLADPQTPAAHNHDAAYAAIAHNHDGSYEPANANLQAHVGQAHAPADAQANADITKAEIEAKLTGEISTHTHAGGGGADPWTYVRLAADFTTSSTTVADVSNGSLFGFTPAANKTYIWEAVLGIRTATATVNPRLGFAWSTGLSDGICTIEQTSTATAKVMVNGNIGAALLLAVGGIPNNNQSWPAICYGTLRSGASPSGACRLQLATETAGTVVRVVAAVSYFRYREIT